MDSTSKIFPSKIFYSEIRKIIYSKRGYERHLGKDEDLRHLRKTGEISGTLWSYISINHGDLANRIMEEIRNSEKKVSMDFRKEINEVIKGNVEVEVITGDVEVEAGKGNVELFEYDLKRMNETGVIGGSLWSYILMNHGDLANRIMEEIRDHEKEVFTSKIFPSKIFYSEIRKIIYSKRGHERNLDKDDVAEEDLRHLRKTGEINGTLWSYISINHGDLANRIMEEIRNCEKKVSMDFWKEINEVAKGNVESFENGLRQMNETGDISWLWSYISIHHGDLANRIMEDRNFLEKLSMVFRKEINEVVKGDVELFENDLKRMNETGVIGGSLWSYILMNHVDLANRIMEEIRDHEKQGLIDFTKEIIEAVMGVESLKDELSLFHKTGEITVRLWGHIMLVHSDLCESIAEANGFRTS